MKFSQRRKNKIRKITQKRVNRVCSSMIGCYVEDGNVKDQAKINNVMYLLVESEKEYSIFKIVKVGEYVKLSAKKVLQNQKKFANHEYWKKHSTIQFTEDGKIKSVKQGSVFGPHGQKININCCIILIVD